MKDRPLVVIAHYDARGPEDLRRLMGELGEVDAGEPFDLLIVVNQTDAPPIDPLFPGTDIIYRENQGFNIGAWHHGWRMRPDHGFYLFLQDECVLQRPGWLTACRTVAEKPGTGYIGESLSTWGSWEAFQAAFPDIMTACEAIARAEDIPMGERPDHLQTLVMGATRRTLELTNGFVAPDDKVDAMAGEVLTSVRATARGLKNRQVALRPFEFIGHPQWQGIRETSGSLRWKVSRALHLMLPAQINRLIPRRY